MKATILLYTLDQGNEEYTQIQCTRCYQLQRSHL